MNPYGSAPFTYSFIVGYSLPVTITRIPLAFFSTCFGCAVDVRLGSVAVAVYMDFLQTGWITPN